jgi:hydroxypyruvate reductase
LRADDVTNRRDILLNLFEAAVAAANPANCVPPALPPPPAGRLIMLAAGKAGASMAAAALAHYRVTAPAILERLSGMVVTRPGYALPVAPLPLVEAGHPVPDAAGATATEIALRLAESATKTDLVLVLLSGGASANWTAPAPGISLQDKQATTRALLRSGIAIGDINTVRRHISRIKGGRLARAAAPARIVTLAISDVPNDDPVAIGSGPTVADPTTLADARAIAARASVDLPASVVAALNDPANETPKPGDPIFGKAEYRIVARPRDAIAAAAARARELGFEPIVLGDALEGEARTVAAEHLRLAREHGGAAPRIALLSGGELTVTVRGNGRGGPNQEYALALAIGIDGEKGLAALAADTDGIDGGAGSAMDPAGAYVDEETAARARAQGRDPAAFLANNDATGFFEPLNALITPGPTFTNVNDFRAILVDTTKAGTA